LTYKATSLSLHRVLKTTGFVEHVPLRPLADPVRHLMVPRQVSDLLNGKRVGTGFPEVAADVIVGRFVAGYLVDISRKSAKNVDLEQLEGIDDVWVLCFRRPRPGWRILGRFLERDVFVGLHAYDRHELGSKAKYTNAAKAIIEAWKAAFGAIEPLRSPNLDSYLSGVYRDVDQNN
jgi:hypothetical protein